MRESRRNLARTRMIRRARRGGAYLFVLGVAMLVTVAGVTALTSARLATRAAADAADWTEAGDLAFSATEHALAYLNAASAAGPSSWRAPYADRQTAFARPLGHGRMSWALKDETDGNLSANYRDPFRLYGIGTVGRATRYYSVQVAPAGAGLDVLRSPLYAAGGLTVPAGATLNAAGGPVAVRGGFVNQGVVNGDVEAAASSGAINGSFTALRSSPTMPSAGVFDFYWNKATPVLYAGVLQPKLLSASRNPYGPADPDGLYAVRCPAGASLTIQASRLRGTLLIDAGQGATVQLSGPILWDPSRADYPILLIRGVNARVRLNGSAFPLVESSAGLNLNPPGTPFEGVSNSTTADAFPSQLRGLVHVLGAHNTVGAGNGLYLHGALLSESPVQAVGVLGVRLDPALLANPPTGYAKGDAMRAVMGSWRWDGAP